MWFVIDILSRVLIDAGIANAILLSLVVVLMVLTRQPSRRVRLAQSGFYAALLMLPMVVLSPLPRLYPLDWMVRKGVMPPQLLPRSSQFATDDPLGRRFKARLGGEGHRPHSSVEWPVGEPLARVLTLLHLGGAALGIGWFGLGLWGFHRLLSRSRAPSEATRKIFDELLADLGRAPPHPDLRVSSWLRGPMLGGVLRPCILIPERLDEDDVGSSSLRLILLHELAHADRGDVWFAALAGVCQSFWFFLPHLWWLRSQLRIDQEFLADRVAAGPTGDSTAYARWLVGLSSSRAVAPVPAAITDEPDGEPELPWWKGGFKSPMLQRVAMLLYCPFRVEEQPPAWYTAVMPILLLTTAATLSTFRLVAPLDPSALLHQSRDSDPLVSSLNIPEFVLVPGRIAVLPLALPPTFHFSAYVIARSADLARIQVAGHPLAFPDADADAIADDLDDPPTPHRIEFRRSLSGMSLTVDDAPVPVEDHHDEERDGPQWLTLTPAPNSTAVFHTLVVTW